MMKRVLCYWPVLPVFALLYAAYTYGRGRDRGAAWFRFLLDPEFAGSWVLFSLLSALLCSDMVTSISSL